MIKAHELRIGNYILGPMGRTGNIIELTVNGASCNLTTPHSLFNYDWIKPIPLTEEWILKFGLQKSNSEWWIRVKSPISEAEQFSIYQIGLSKFVFDISQHININLLYVHQLQNLFFALVGEEIEIK